MAADLVPQDSDNVESVGLSQAQVTALERLHEIGAAPREPDEKYDPDPQIRALQLVAEGKLGGSRKGARAREQRLSVGLTEHVRQNLTPKVKRALERALQSDAGERINLDAIKLIVDIENKEAKLQITEDQADIDSQTKEQLLATLFELVSDAQTGGVINATFTDVPTASPSENRLLEIDRQARDQRTKDLQRERNKTRSNKRRADREAERERKAAASATPSGRRHRGTPSSVVDGLDLGSPRPNGREQPKGDRPANRRPISKAALRRATDG